MAPSLDHVNVPHGLDRDLLGNESDDFTRDVGTCQHTQSQPAERNIGEGNSRSGDIYRTGTDREEVGRLSDASGKHGIVGVKLGDLDDIARGKTCRA